MNLIGLCRLGRDAEIRYTQSGAPVASFSAAFDFGRKDADGKRPTQWIDLSLWGDRAEKVADMLTKGTRLMVVASDVHVETFERRDGGQGSKLVARVDSFEFAGSRQDREQGDAPAPRESGQAPARSERPARQAAPNRADDFDAMDDDIPF